MKAISKFKFFFVLVICCVIILIVVFHYKDYKIAINFVSKNLKNLDEAEQIVPQNAKVSLTIASTKFDVALADTSVLREKGLGGRLSLLPEEGMLFDFKTDDYHAFWMKNMFFSIDIIWINAENKVIDFAENIHPDTYPQSFVPKKVARRVLELQAGTVNKIGIKIGDQVVY